MTNNFEDRYYKFVNVFRDLNKISNKKQPIIIILSQVLVDLILAPIDKIKLLIQTGKIKSGYQYFLMEKNYKKYWRGSLFYVPKAFLFYSGIQIYEKLKKKNEFSYLFDYKYFFLFFNLIFPIEYLRIRYVTDCQKIGNGFRYNSINNYIQKSIKHDFNIFFKTYFFSNIIFGAGYLVSSYIFMLNLLFYGLYYDSHSSTRKKEVFFNFIYFPLLVRTTSYPFEFIVRNMATRKGKPNNIIEKIKIKKYFFRGFGYGLFKGSLKIILWTELINFITKNEDFF